MTTVINSHKIIKSLSFKCVYHVFICIISIVNKFTNDKYLSKSAIEYNGRNTFKDDKTV